MERSFRTLSAGVVAGLALISTVAAAQGGAGRGRGGPPPANPDQPAPDRAAQPPRMMAPPGSPAEMLLRQREQLELTDDQAKRLERLAKSQKDALKPNRATMLRAQADLADAEDKENLDGQRSALEKLAKIHIDEDIAHRKAQKDARDVLTQDQRDKMRGGMMRGLAPGGRGGIGRGGRAGFGGGMPGRGMVGRRGGAQMGPQGGVPSARLNGRMRPVRPPTDSAK